MPNERVFDKNVNSAFKDTGLLDYLHEKGEDTIIIVGLQTDYCIDATVKCGFEHGFKMIVPANANSIIDNAYITAENSYKYYDEFMWDGRYAECISFDKTLVYNALKISRRCCLNDIDLRKIFNYLAPDERFLRRISRQRAFF